MAEDFRVRVTNPERAAEWREVLGADIVCVRSPVPRRANLPGHLDALIYLLDLDLLTEEQRVKLVAHLSAKFGIPERRVAAELDTHGLPVLAQDCSVSVHNPQRWL
jgi:hypothetical protein